jgi:thiol-disulfide isomerase/thioredoxin
MTAEMKSMSKTSLNAILALLLVMFASLPLIAEEAAGVKALDADQIKAVVGEQEGKVVVLNFWATWCPPCIKEFPDIIKLYDTYESQGLQVIAVSMNEPEEVEDIAEFLAEHKPRFPVYRAASTEEEFYADFDEKWWGEMPMTMIYDKTGKVIKMHKKPLTYEEFEQDVKALIN